jgi:hypothetical protein
MKCLIVSAEKSLHRVWYHRPCGECFEAVETIQRKLRRTTGRTELPLEERGEREGRKRATRERRERAEREREERGRREGGEREREGGERCEREEIGEKGERERRERGEREEPPLNPLSPPLSVRSGPSSAGSVPYTERPRTERPSSVPTARDRARPRPVITLSVL